MGLIAAGYQLYGSAAELTSLYWSMACRSEQSRTYLGQM